MKYVFLVLAALFSSSTFAADLPVKAAPLFNSTPCVAGSCSGWYAGFGILGDGNNADIVGGGLNNSVFQTGGAIMVSGGYQIWNAAWFAAFEVSGGYEFSQNNVALQGGNRFVGTELVKLGYNFFPSSATAPTAPSQSPVPLVSPASILSSSTPYLAFGGMQRRGINEWVNGAGVETVIASGYPAEMAHRDIPPQNSTPRL